MTPEEFEQLVEDIIVQVLPQAGGIVLDIGKVNDVLLEIAQRKRDRAPLEEV